MDQWGGILRLDVYIEALTLKELTSGLCACAECIVLPVCEISSFLPVSALRPRNRTGYSGNRRPANPR